MKSKVLLAVIAIGSTLFGCSGSAQASPADDKTAKDNFSRALTPEEAAGAGGAPPPAVTKGK